MSTFNKILAYIQIASIVAVGCFALSLLDFHASFTVSIGQLTTAEKTQAIALALPLSVLGGRQ